MSTVVPAKPNCVDYHARQPRIHWNHIPAHYGDLQRLPSPQPCSLAYHFWSFPYATGFAIPYAYATGHSPL